MAGANPNRVHDDYSRLGESTDCKRLTESTVARLTNDYLATIPSYPGIFDGRGIVICAGGRTYFTCAWVLIRMLRHLGCSLPVQVWYRGPHEYDHAWSKLAAAYGVHCVDADAVRLRKGYTGQIGGWELKPFSLLHTPYREVLLLDADNVPVIDPTYLFDVEQYHQSGAVFWPDGLRTPRCSPRWEIFGVEYRDEPEQESGQVLVHKERCWTALNLCNWYNQHSDFFYRFVYGDKDTFRFAWHRRGQAFAMPSQALVKVPGALYQHDFEARRVFQHRCLAKWSLTGNCRVRDFKHEKQCLAWLQELGRRWPPPNTLP